MESESFVDGTGIGVGADFWAGVGVEKFFDFA